MPSKRKSPKSPARSVTTKPAAAKTSADHAAIAPAAVLNVTASYEGIVIKPPPYDPVVAKTLLDAFRPRLAAIAQDKLAVPRLVIRASALAALGVYAFITQVEKVHAWFKKLDQIGQFHMVLVEDLKSVVFLVLYTHAQAETAGAFANQVKVPPKLVEEGSAVEKRMQALCEYKFKQDPAIAPLLSVLSPGTGYEDLAGDLFGYADIYELRSDEVASDTTHYRSTDVADARRIAGEILAHLAAGMSPKARDAYDLMVRAWTLLLQIYFEIRELGLYLLRYDPKRNERLPSLFASGRSGRPKKTSEDAGQAATGQATPPAE